MIINLFFFLLRLFAQQIPLDELLLFYYYCCSVTEYNIKVRSWINFDTSDSSLGYSSSKHFETTMVTLALAVRVCGARAGTLNLTQRIGKKIIRSFEEKLMVRLMS